jgi:hypothetical protein
VEKMGEGRNTYIWKTEAKTDLREIDCEYGRWMGVAQNNIQ